MALRGIYRLSILFFCAVFLALPFGVRGQEASERIVSFDVQLYVRADGMVDVTETIVYDFGVNDRHGIYRTIPLRSAAGERLDVSNIAVIDTEGSEYEVMDSTDDGVLSIRIGDPDEFVTGTRTYVISYKVEHALEFFQEFDELYWNVTGNEWTVPIDYASARVHLPGTLSEDSMRVACYAGVVGVVEQCETSHALHSEESDTVIVFSEENLTSRAGLTIAVGFPKGVVQEPYNWSWLYRIWQYVALVLGALLPIGAFVVLYRRWKREGDDPASRGTIIPQYDVPDGLAPIEVAGLFRSRISPKDISAQLVYLAEQGYLTICHLVEKGLLRSTDEFTLRRVKDLPENALLYDQLIFNGIFSDGRQEVALSELTKEQKFYTHIPNIQTDVAERLTNTGYYRTQPLRAGSVLVLAFIPAFLCAAAIGAILQSVRYDPSVAVLAGAGVASLIAAVFGFIMPAKTRKGVDATDYLKGLREYLQIAEKDRLAFHNAPTKNAEQFEKLLPYAMVFGVEEAWAKEFADIYRTQPSWYTDATGSAFNTIAFTHMLSSFSTTTASSVVASPSSSSGSGGGGFSGGGGGGGGGGSW